MAEEGGPPATGVGRDGGAQQQEHHTQQKQQQQQQQQQQMTMQPGEQQGMPLAHPDEMRDGMPPYGCPTAGSCGMFIRSSQIHISCFGSRVPFFHASESRSPASRAPPLSTSSVRAACGANALE